MMMTHKWTVLFPGQGSQRVGMIKDLLQRWPHIVTPILEDASEATKINLKKLMLVGPQENLTQTPIAQPAILTHSYAVLSILRVSKMDP
jgi:[acyl-carrier-protein] S-malonyltransferase